MTLCGTAAVARIGCDGDAQLDGLCIGEPLRDDDGLAKVAPDAAGKAWNPAELAVNP